MIPVYSGNVCASGKSCVAGSCVTILVNGDFETGDTTGWQYFAGASCTSSITVSTSQNIITSAESGSYFAWTGCTSSYGAGLQQTVSLNVGQTYTVTGYYNAGVRSSVDPNGGYLFINGTTLTSVINTYYDANWHQITATFMAFSPSATFGFSMYSTDQSNTYYPGWDNFVIV